AQTVKPAPPADYPVEWEDNDDGDLEGGWLDHGHVLACRLGSHPGQHAVFGDLRQERRGCVRAAPLSRVLLSRRIRRGNDADRDDPALRLRLRRTDTHLGASGAMAAVMGAYFVLYPDSRISTLVLWFPVRIPAWFFLGGWFLYQFFAGNYGLIPPSNTGGSGVAFFAHVGGFIFGAVVAGLLSRTGRVTIPAARWSPT